SAGLSRRQGARRHERRRLVPGLEPRGHPLMRRLIWPLLGVEAALATALAATPWLRAFHVTGTAAVLVAAAMCSVAVSVLTTVRWRQSPVASYMWSLAALVVFLLAAI